MAAISLVLAGVGLAPAHPAWAQARLDVSRTYVVGSSRVVGLGGAYAGVAEGVQGYSRNPAALANRGHHAVDWYEWDAMFDWTLYPGDDVDLDNDGDLGASDRENNALSAGFGAQWGRFGMGLVLESSRYIVYQEDAPRHEIASLRSGLGFGWSFADGAWLAGVGLGASEFNVDDHESVCQEEGAQGTVDCEIRYDASALDLGLLYRPQGAPWRVGVGYRRGAFLQLRPASASLTVTGGGAPLPDTIEEPDTFTIGASYLWGRRAMNYNVPIRSGDGWGKERGRVAAGGDEGLYLLLAADIVFIEETTSRATSFERFASGEPTESVRSSSLSAHLGVEAEILEDRLIVRAGGYTEPDRASGEDIGRLHFTGGFDWKVFEAIWTWRLSVAGDLAPRYQNVLFGLGVWPDFD